MDETPPCQRAGSARNLQARTILPLGERSGKANEPSNSQPIGGPGTRTPAPRSPSQGKVIPSRLTRTLSRNRAVLKYRLESLRAKVITTARPPPGWAALNPIG